MYFLYIIYGKSVEKTSPTSVYSDVTFAGSIKAAFQTRFTRFRTNFKKDLVLYLCYQLTRNRANSVTDCITVYTSPHKFAVQKTCTVPRVPCKRKTEPSKFLSVQIFVWTLENGVSVSLFLLSLCPA